MDPLFFVHISALEQIIKIPLAFIDKHMKEENLTCAMLQDHKGGLFPVKIEEDHSFGEGWHKFSRDHNLKVGNFLAFRYNGFMVFTVEVCNQSTTSARRDSPVDAQDAVMIDEEESTQPQNIPSSTSMLFIMQDKDAPLKNQDMYQQADSLFEDESHEILILDGDTESSHDCEDEDDDSEFAYESFDADVDNDGDYAEESLDKNEDNDNDHADKSLDEDLVDDVLSSAGEMPFKCNTDDQECCSINIILRRSYAYGPYLVLPLLFATINQLERRSSANVILVDPVGKKFEGLRFYIYTGSQIRIGGGWPKYSKAQGLREGDKITVKIVENTMEVVKFQLSHNVPLKGLQSEKKSGKELKPDILEHRSFRKLLKSTYSLVIPKGFVERNSLAGRLGNIVLQDGNGGLWNVSFHNNTIVTVMQGGWSKVVEAKKLKVGDLIRFTLIETTPNPVMRFKVLRSADLKGKGLRSRCSTINKRL